MTQVGLYLATGTYPNLSKSTLKYTFYPEPTFHWMLRKINDYEDIPWMAAPIVYDSFSQDRKLIVKGTFKSTGAADPPGAKTVKERFEDLDNLSFMTSTFSNQPESSDVTETVYCLEITFPDTSTKQHFVTFENLDVKWDGGTTHLSYTLTLKEVKDVYLI